MRARAVLVVAAVAVATAGVAGRADAGPGVPQVGQGSPPVERSGAAALNAIGTRVDAVAARHGWSAAQVREELRHDPRLRWDGSGLLYVEPVAAAPSVSASPSAATVPQPLTSTFELHSKPGATRVIYLDFNGHSTSGTSWNSGRTDPIVSGPYDFDGGASVFTDAELQRIQYIWARVADDFAPLDVDVTTQDPGLEALRKTSSSDAEYGQRVVISDTNWYNTSAGGVAYIGSFNWSSDTPTYVFADQLGNGNEKYVAEAASHEAGHTVGLAHDGTASVGYYEGHGSWAPIMGVGYYEPVVQWSRGEYAGANNTQDDLTIMGNYGVAVRADLVGDTPATAQALSGAGTLTATGRIERRTDKDVFSFTTAAGLVSVSVVPTNPHEPTLDAQARLLNSSGAQVALSNPALVGSPTLSATLAAGTYYVEVDGVGEGDPATTGYSDYASLGEFDVTVTVPSANGQPPVAVAAASPTSGTAPLTVTYSSAGSSDPDGSIVAVAWSFSDGTSSTSASVTKTYSVAGNYTATLTVTDNAGNSATANAPTVSVTAASQSAGITSLVVQSTGSRKGRAQITVATAGGTPVVGATVTGVWTGALSGTQSAVTNSSGVATINSARGNRGTATFTTTNVAMPAGYTWDGVNKSGSANIR